MKKIYINIFMVIALLFIYSCGDIYSKNNSNNESHGDNKCVINVADIDLSKSNPLTVNGAIVCSGSKFAHLTLTSNYQSNGNDNCSFKMTSNIYNINVPPTYKQNADVTFEAVNCKPNTKSTYTINLTDFIYFDDNYTFNIHN